MFPSFIRDVWNPLKLNIVEARTQTQILTLGNSLPYIAEFVIYLTWYKVTRRFYFPELVAVSFLAVNHKHYFWFDSAM